MITKNPLEAVQATQQGSEFVLFNGPCERLLECLPDDMIDLVLTSPPYFMGKDYDRSYKVADFYADHNTIAPSIERVTRVGGNVCWQVGYHVNNGTIVPLDFAVFEVFREKTSLILRNRIIWHFGHGTHAKRRFSGRHETLLWYSKGSDFDFSLDEVRVPQKYPGKKHYKGLKKGAFSGNPLGKNPSDVWSIPNVKANHVEKTAHPCQFPIALAERVVKALSQTAGLVFDPFSGSGTSGIAAVMSGRRYLGAETSAKYCKIAEKRYTEFQRGELAHRPADKPIWVPGENDSVAKRPSHFIAPAGK